MATSYKDRKYIQKYVFIDQKQIVILDHFFYLIISLTEYIANQD